MVPAEPDLELARGHAVYARCASVTYYLLQRSNEIRQFACALHQTARQGSFFRARREPLATYPPVCFGEYVASTHEWVTCTDRTPELGAWCSPSPHSIGCIGVWYFPVLDIPHTGARQLRSALRIRPFLRTCRRTMASADFSPPLRCETSHGTSNHFPAVPKGLPPSVTASCAPSPGRGRLLPTQDYPPPAALYPVPVCRNSCLPPPPSAMSSRTPPCPRLMIPATRLIRDSHPRAVEHAWHTNQRGLWAARDRESLSRAKPPSQTPFPRRHHHRLRLVTSSPNPDTFDRNYPETFNRT